MKIGLKLGRKIPQKYHVYIMHGVFIFIQNRKFWETMRKMEKNLVKVW